MQALVDMQREKRVAEGMSNLAKKKTKARIKILEDALTLYRTAAANPLPISHRAGVDRSESA